MASTLIAAVLLAQQCGPPPTPAEVVAYPSGTIIENVGTSDIPITSQSEKAKLFIRQGFALIHCFWFNEAIRSFRDAVKEDPTCAMAWCGLNISLTQPWNISQQYKAEADYAIQRAIQLSGDVSDAEQELIAAFRLRSFGKDDRGGDFEKAMEEHIVRYPDLKEPRLIWASIRCQRCLGIAFDKSGNPRFELEKVSELIKPILAKEPDNPAACHYDIHAMESIAPEKALGSARRLGKSASGSGHMVHMPGHIFYNLGLWDEGRPAFEGCRKIEEDYAAKLGVSPQKATWNYGHNVRFLLFHLIEMGRFEDAKSKIAIIGSEPGLLEERMGDFGGLSSALLQSKQIVGTSAEKEWMLGMASVSSNQIITAKQHLAALEEMLGSLGSDQNNHWQLSIRRARRAAYLELAGSIAFAEKRPEDGQKLLNESLDEFEMVEYQEPPSHVRMPHETLGWALIEAGKPGDAAEVFRRALKQRPNSGWLLFGLAEAIRAKDGDEAAKPHYDEFLKQWKDADPNMPYMLKARERLAAMN